jgi:hypothetical protein
MWVGRLSHRLASNCEADAYLLPCKSIAPSELCGSERSCCGIRPRNLGELLEEPGIRLSIVADKVGGLTAKDLKHL